MESPLTYTIAPEGTVLMDIIPNSLSFPLVLLLSLLGGIKIRYSTARHTIINP